MKINICFGASVDYMQHIGCLIASILANSKHIEDEFNFFILSNCFNQKDKDYFKQLSKIRLCKIKFLKIDDKEFDGAVHDLLGVSASYRLKIFELLPKESKILYLDSDVIVRDDIRELYKTDISDYYCAAVEDKLNLQLHNRVNMNDEETYINSGVLLLNLDKCRDNHIQEQMFEGLKQVDKWTDQDAINYFMKGHIKLLDLKWNLMYPYDNTYKDKNYYEKVAQNPSIVHYTTKLKPWKPGTAPYMKLEYFKYLKMTPWYKDTICDYILEENLGIIRLLGKLISAIE